MLRKLTLLFGGAVLALMLAFPASAVPAKKPSPAAQACLAALKQQPKTFHEQQKAASKAFHQQQEAANKAFPAQQKAAKAACKALP